MATADVDASRCTVATCDPHADCSDSPAGPVCRCRSEFKGDGHLCIRYPSCNDLHRGEPALTSGPRVVQPASSSLEFPVYCDMATSGGGWSLVLNDGTTFDPQTQGVTTAVCYDTNCTNRAYSTLPVGGDVMLDMRDGDIRGDAYLARVIVLGVHSGTVGKTVRTLFTTGPFFLEKEDNSNVVITTNAAGCSVLPADMRLMFCNECDAAVCTNDVMVFGDQGSDSACPESQNLLFAIGGWHSYSSRWANCAGWPQIPNQNGFNYYPDNFRVWIR